MRAQFIRGEDPKKSMKIGVESKVQDLLNKVGTMSRGSIIRSVSGEYLTDEDFKDDNLIIHLFKKDYDRWKEKAGKIKIEDIKIWSTRTSGNTPIIKISAPGVRETTLLRGESDFYRWVSEDIIKLLNSEKIKKEFADGLNKSDLDIDSLGSKIFTSANRKGLIMGNSSTADRIAKRLVELLK